MGCLKSMGTFVCSFLFFLALTIFSIAFMLHSTILSSDFVTKQVNRIDISSIARDIAEKQIGSELPEQAKVLKDVAYDVIAKQEPWIKEQLDNAINTGYDFFLGKSNALKISVPLADLKASLKNDLWDASQKYLQQQLSGMTDRDISSYLQDFINQIPAGDLPPELASLSYDQQNIAIEEYLREFAGQKPLANIPPEITSQVKSQVKPYFDQYYAEFTNDIPDSFIVDEAKIGPGTMDSLLTVRKYIGYFQTGYYWIVIFMVLMAGLIFVINYNVKVTARTLGIDLLVFGILDVGGAILSKNLSPLKLIPDISQIPVSVQDIIDNVYKDVTSIALNFGIGVLAAGVVLLVVSFIVKRKEAWY
jgi:hypothetical protein